MTGTRESAHTHTHAHARIEVSTDCQLVPLVPLVPQKVSLRDTALLDLVEKYQISLVNCLVADWRQHR